MDSKPRWTPTMWLAWLGYFVLDPALHRFSAERWGYTAAGTLVFLALYFGGRGRRGERPKLWAIAGMAALGLAFLPSNSGACVFLGYAAAFAGLWEDTTAAFSTLLVLELGAAVLLWWFHLSAALWVSTALLIAAIGTMNIQMTQRLAAHERLRLAQEEIERLAKEAERERIARDLHDVLGHTLSVIVLKSELASRLAEREPARAAREIGDVERVARDALAEVRSTIRGYRAVGLEEEISRARGILAAAGIEARVSTALDGERMDPVHEQVLALAVREGVTNVARHSHAQRCDVRLTHSGGVCQLEIADDGTGGAAREGHGLRGMRERVESLGGSLKRMSAPGTTLTIALPRAVGEPAPMP